MDKELTDEYVSFSSKPCQDGHHEKESLLLCSIECISRRVGLIDRMEWLCTTNGADPYHDFIRGQNSLLCSRRILIQEHINIDVRLCPGCVKLTQVGNARSRAIRGAGAGAWRYTPVQCKIQGFQIRKMYRQAGVVQTSIAVRVNKLVVIVPLPYGRKRGIIPNLSSKANMSSLLREEETEGALPQYTDFQIHRHPRHRCRLTDVRSETGHTRAS